MNKIKWTLESCLQDAIKYNTKIDWIKSSPSAYKKSRENGWLEECCKHMKPARTRPTKEECIKDALKYNSHNEWMKNSSKYYNCAREYKWMNCCCEHMLHNLVVKFTTIDDCKSIALECKTKTEFKKKNRKCYIFCKKNGWLEECCKHMKKRDYKKWNKQECIEDALKYNTRSSWFKNSKLYRTAHKNGWLDECCKHMKQIIKPNYYWTKERCIESASLCETRSQFQKKFRGAYLSVKRNGWSEECYKHMKICGHIYKRMIYSYEFEDNSVYVGLTCNENKRKVSHRRKDSSVYKHIEKTGIKPIYKKNI